MPQNLSPTLDPLPQPSAVPPVAVQTAKEMYQTPPDPQGPYYGGKAGAVADIANHVLTGWMAGQYMGQQKAQQKAASQIGTMKDAVDTVGQAYRAAVEGGDPKKIEAAGNVLKQQWDEYNAAREKYVVPSDLGKDGKKKSAAAKAGGAVKSAFAPHGPELYLQAALNASKQIDPRDLYGPSKKEQNEAKRDEAATETATLQNKEMKQESEFKDNYRKVLEKPEKDLTAEDKKLRDTYEQMHGKTKEQLFQDQILEKVVGGKPLDEYERTRAEGMGLIKPAVTSTQVHTVAGPSGRPQTQLIAIGPDGKMVGQPQTLPGNDYVPPDQAQMAGRVINAEVSAYARLLQKAHPEWDEQTRYSMALGQVSKGTQMDWAVKNQQQDVMNRALLKMIQTHTKTYKDKETGNPVREYDDEGNVLMSHFVSSSDDGRYSWNANLGDKSDPGWWGKLWGEKENYGGYTPQQLQQYDKQARAELRAILKEQNKGLSDSMIDQMMPASGFGQKQAGQPQPGGITLPPPPPAPKQGAATNTPQGVPPGMGQKIYAVTTSEGQVQRPMTDEQAESLKAQGVRVMLVGGSTP